MTDSQELYSDSDEEETEETEETEEEEEEGVETDNEEEVDADDVVENEEADDDEGDVNDKNSVDDNDNDITNNYEDDEDEEDVEFGGGISDEEEEEDDEINNKTLQKFNEELKKNYILDFHPECSINNYDEIATLTIIIRDKNGNIIDDLHQTIPFLTKYERTRVLGQRAKQINSGAKAFVNVPEKVIDGYLVAEMELMQKRLPFIICRPIPSGGREYWNLKDLEIVSF